jgi:hypothetical protein
MPKGTMQDFTGQRFGRLTAISPIKTIGVHRHLSWRCVCDCGNTTTVTSHNLRQEKTKSCGCLQTESKRSRDTKKRKIELKDHATIYSHYCDCVPIKDIARIYGVTPAAIYLILRECKNA